MKFQYDNDLCAVVEEIDLLRKHWYDFWRTWIYSPQLDGAVSCSWVT